MEIASRIFVAGHRGLVGSAIVRALQRKGYLNVITRTRQELDLSDHGAVRSFFESHQPEYVFLAAAKVGGILANSMYPAEFIYENLAIQTNVIHESWRSNAKRLLFLGSSCIYPRECRQPIREEYLLNGPLEPTNRPYAVAKIAGIEMCWAYNRQYNTQFVAAMPTNLYGPGDNYDLETSHVIPALIRKMHEAKMLGRQRVSVWGSGTPKREFLYSDDLADACVHLMSIGNEEFSSVLNLVHGEVPPIVNIGYGDDITIKELADMIARVVGFNGEVMFDSSKPDGTPRKLLDSARLEKLRWRPRTDLESGLMLAYEEFRNGTSDVTHSIRR